MSYPWHTQLETRLDGLAAAGRIAGGVLLSQPRGWGIAALGASFAWRLLERPARSLEELREFAHPDFRLVERPPERTRIVVEQIRSAAEFVIGTAQHGRKVTLILGAEDMNPNAANALLKTLEEPPAGNVIVLVSEAPERLLPTVRSRCQQFAARAGARAAARSWLTQQGLTEADADLGLALAGAPLGLAATGAEAPEPGPARFVELLLGLLDAQDDQAPLTIARELADGHLEVLLVWWLNAVRLGLRVANGAPPALGGLDAALARLPAERLLAFVDALTQAREVLQVNANRPMLVDRLAWQFAGLEHRMPAVI